MNNKWKKTLLIIGDIFVLYLSLYLTLILRYKQNPTNELWQSHLLPFSFIFIVWLMIFYTLNLYNLNILVSNYNFFKKLFQSLLIGTAIAIIFFYAIPFFGIAPKTNLAIFTVVFIIIIFLWRQTFNWSLASYLPKNNIAIIGQNQLVREITAILAPKPHLGYKISFIIDIEEKDQKELNGIPIFSNIEELERLIIKKNINNIILATNPSDSTRLRGVLFKCLPLKINFIKLIDFYENISGRVPIETINKMWFLENINEGGKQLFDIVKRIFDLVLAFSLLLLSFIFWIPIAIIIKVESRGPIFFTQIRSGKNGNEFKMLKFRTMKTEDNNQAPTTLNDKRITRFGNFLRLSRIDEIPQILNIIKGDMSFIGPRPERPEIIESLEKQVPFYKERMLVKPGVTGWDQVCGEYHSPSLEDTMKKLQYDLFYVKNRSIFLDGSIILKTINTVLSRAGR